MTPKNPILALTCLLVVLPIALAGECPSREELAPCKCLGGWPKDGLTTIECRGIDDEGLARAASSLRGKKVFKFHIQDSKLGRIPHDVFKGVQLRGLQIEKTTLAALTDADEAFVGLEDHLEELVITMSVYQNEWDWSVLRKLKTLRTLYIIDSIHLETIGTDLMKASVPNLDYIFLARNNISSVSDFAFDSHKDMKDLIVKFNKITHLKRTMLPSPALKLEKIDFSYNLIEEIPQDMFTKMPNLQDLFLYGNKILALDETTFSPVWEQLRFFFIDDYLHCDCSVSWILKKRSPGRLLGGCASPPELKGKQLMKLESKDFVC